MERLLIRSVLFATAIAIGIATSAHAQSPPPQSTWRFASGLGWLSLRDVARTRHPVDQSLIAWSGHGNMFEGARRREKGRRTQELEVTLAAVRSFQYESPLLTESRPSGDRYRSLEAVYEYRHYVKSNLFMKGLDVGVGLQGLGRFASATRNIAGGAVQHESYSSAGGGVSAVARIRRWSRIGGEVAWTNGLRLYRINEQHSEIPVATPAHLGGGWLTSVSVALTTSVTPHASVVVRYIGAGEGAFARHHSETFTRGAISVGVVYAK